MLEKIRGYIRVFYYLVRHGTSNVPRKDLRTEVSRQRSIFAEHKALLSSTLDRLTILFGMARLGSTESRREKSGTSPL